MKKKFFSIVLIAMLFLLAMSTVALADDRALLVNGHDILSENTVEVGSGTAVYDANTNTLTLTNVTINNENSYKARAALIEYFIEAQNMDELTIKVVGDYTLDTKKETPDHTAGVTSHIYATGGTNIKIIGDSAGSSKLTLKNICNNGIYVENGTLTIEKITLDISSTRYCAITSGELNITDSRVTVNTAVQNGKRIYMYDTTSNKSQDITINNSTLDLTSSGDGVAVVFNDNKGEIKIANDNALVKAEGDSTDLLEGKTVAQVLSDIKTNSYKKILLQVTNKQLDVNGKDILRAPDNTVACGDGTAKYDIDSNTLTLTNAEIESEYGIHIKLNSGTAPLTTKLVLVGENTIDAKQSGIWSEKGDLEISGTGSLAIENSNGEGIDMWLTGNIDILGDSADEMLKIEIDSGSLGICGGDLTIKNAEIKIEAKGNGIYISKVAIENAILDSYSEYSYSTIYFNDVSNEVEIGDTLVRAENDGEDLLTSKTKAEIIEMIKQGEVGQHFIIRTVDRVYTVSYEPGEYGRGDSVSALKIHGDDLELADELFTRSGYQQVGWATEDGGEKVYELAGTYTANVDVTLYPVWQKKSSSYVAQVPSYTLSFVTNGGSGIVAINQSSDVTIDLSQYKTTRDGYTFAGWYSDKALKNKITSIKLESDTTIYAAWQEIAKEEEKTPSVVEKPFDFVDVHSNDWFYDDAKWAFEQGLMMGTTADNFSPNTFTTRGMIVTILWRMEGSPVVNYAMPFSDVADGMWYSEAIRWAVSEGIVNGYSATRFAPDDNITREQLAAMLYNYAKYKGIDVSVGEDTNILSYDDAFDISEYAYEAMQWAIGEGIIGGMTDSTIAPQNLATRAQVAAMLHRFAEIV